MSHSILRTIIAARCFDDKTTRDELKTRAKFAAIPVVYNVSSNKLLHHYTPNPQLTIDEHLVPFRGRREFVQYMPAKPDKHGIKFFWVVDSTNVYPLMNAPYLGKEGSNVLPGLANNVVMTFVDLSSDRTTMRQLTVAIHTWASQKTCSQTNLP